MTGRTKQEIVLMETRIQKEVSLGEREIIPREARPKASRSGVYNFVPQRAQAG